MELICLAVVFLFFGLSFWIVNGGPKSQRLAYLTGSATQSK
jgi:hypothetical protein